MKTNTTSHDTNTKDSPVNPDDSSRESFEKIKKLVRQRPHPSATPLNKSSIETDAPPNAAPEQPEGSVTDLPNKSEGLSQDSANESEGSNKSSIETERSSDDLSDESEGGPPSAGAGAGAVPHYSSSERRELHDYSRLIEQMRTLSFSGLENYPVSVAVWNCDPPQINAIKKRHFIREILNSLNCDLVLLQEAPWVAENFPKRHVEGAPDQEYFTPAGRMAVICNPFDNKHAPILYDPSVIRASEIEIQLRTRALNGRVTAAIVIRLGSNGFAEWKFLAVSVHLPHREEKKYRKGYLLEVITAAVSLADSHTLPLIIGGDFNYPSDDKGLEDMLPKGFRLLATNGIDYYGFYGKIDAIATEFNLKDEFDDGAVRRLDEAELSVKELIDAYAVGGAHVPKKLSLSV